MIGDFTETEKLEGVRKKQKGVTQNVAKMRTRKTKKSHQEKIYGDEGGREATQACN